MSVGTHQSMLQGTSLTAAAAENENVESSNADARQKKFETLARRLDEVTYVLRQLLTDGSPLQLHESASCESSVSENVCHEEQDGKTTGEGKKLREDLSFHKIFMSAPVQTEDKHLSEDEESFHTASPYLSEQQRRQREQSDRLCALVDELKVLSQEMADQMDGNFTSPHRCVDNASIAETISLLEETFDIGRDRERETPPTGEERLDSDRSTSAASARISSLYESFGECPVVKTDDANPKETTLISYSDLMSPISDSDCHLKSAQLIEDHSNEKRDENQSEDGQELAAVERARSPPSESPTIVIRRGGAETPDPAPEAEPSVASNLDGLIRELTGVVSSEIVLERIRTYKKRHRTGKSSCHRRKPTEDEVSSKPSSDTGLIHLSSAAGSTTRSARSGPNNRPISSKRGAALAEEPPLFKLQSPVGVRESSKGDKGDWIMAIERRNQLYLDGSDEHIYETIDDFRLFDKLRHHPEVRAD